MNKEACSLTTFMGNGRGSKVILCNIGFFFLVVLSLLCCVMSVICIMCKHAQVRAVKKV